MSKIIFNGVDYAGGSGNYFNPVIYSDVERVIGVWRDNKPLYAKTISIGTLPNNATKTTAHGISDIDTICSIDGIAYDGSGKTLPLGYINVDSYTYDVQVEVGKVNVEIKTKIDFSSYTGYITLRYTKTTDVAGSGDYNTYGVPTHHYSTSEQVIGTWVNGKPLYETTFSFTIGSAHSTVYQTGIANIDRIVNLQGQVDRGDGWFMSVNFSRWDTSSADLIGAMMNKDGRANIFVVDSFYYGLTVYMTVQYTKTTD